MSRKRVYSSSEKLRAIKDYVSGEKGVTQICTEMTINIATFYEWLRKYNASGESSLIVSKNIKYYPNSVKFNAVYK
ncbi:transposase [Clostridium saccharobutylicum]|uniref:Transposase n=1 Tax=Clostridium saccharobutylicum TaxID=169679 RepID=A0A1S8MTF8_CLOSA|nr:transposase [Clostridium saccharobutylicum]OOM07461.1 transposase [Clostridium saccharobutylicum]